MTDIMKLIEEACSTAAKYELENYYGTSKDYTAMCKVEAEEAQRALQSAIEALQGEVELLKQQKETMRLDYKELELLLTEDENIERDRDAYRGKAEALQAKLDELQRQEPAAYLFTDIQSGDIEVSLYEDEKPRSQWHRKSLYAAPKALEPQARCEHCDGTGDVHDQTGEWRGRCDCDAGRYLDIADLVDGTP